MLRIITTLVSCLAIAGALLAGPDAHAQTDQGLWEAPFDHGVPMHWLPGQPGWDGDPALGNFMAGHMALIPTGYHRGSVLVWNWMRVDGGAPTDVQYWSIVDPAANPPTFLNFELPVETHVGDLFCSGHAWTKDGHLLVCGGNRWDDEEAEEPTPIAELKHDDESFSLNANRLCFRFDPEAPTGNAMWVPEPDMYHERWYPTVTTMGTDSAGRDLLLVTGGIDLSGQGPVTYEAFDPTNPPGSGTWQPNPNKPMMEPYFDGPGTCAVDNLFAYPRHALLTSGKLFTGGMTGLGHRVDHFNVAPGMPPVWEVQTPDPFIPQRSYASVFLFPNLGGPGGGFEDIVVRVGGSGVLWDYNACQPLSAPVVLPTTEFSSANLPSTDPNWRWFSGPIMQTPRTFADTVVLPDATVVAIGGSDNAGVPVLATELLNDIPFAWRTVAPTNVNRQYHTTAVLLPSGKVLVGGGELRINDYSVYQPPYLTNGTVRPVIVNGPRFGVMKYGKAAVIEYEHLPDGVRIEKAVLMAPGSITHHSDMHQRYVELEGPVSEGEMVSESGNPLITFLAPPNSNHAPKGYYMLFLVTNPQGTANKGTPSEATWVKLQ